MHRALQRVREHAGEDDGFTLIELMVVVMILGILITMGLPTFLGVKARFQDRAAETDLRNVVLAARILYTDKASYINANESSTGVIQILSNGCYVAGATPSVTTGATCVSGSGGSSTSVASTAAQFAAARASASAVCFVILDSTSGTTYGKTTLGANCTASWAATPGNVTATSPAAAGW